MIRVPALVVVFALMVAGCAGSSPADEAAAEATETGEPREVTRAESPVAAGTVEPQAPTTDDLERATPEREATQVTLLLPDQSRWVVVDDWGSSDDAGGPFGGSDGLQLDVAPLDDEGVPQLGRRISLNYQLGEVEDFDQRWGDTSSMGTPTDFETNDGVGRTVRNTDVGVSMAQVWRSGTFVYAQTMDPDADLADLAATLVEVDDSTWRAARAGAEDQRLVAVEAAMRNVGGDVAETESLPHWVLPEPWQVKWVTDMTIWTAEQQAQRVAFAEANRSPASEAARASEYRSWRFGFAETPDEAARQFVPQMTITVLVFDQAPSDFYPTNYETFSALGLDGVISPVGGVPSISVELGRGTVRVFGRSWNLEKGQVEQFFEAADFAGDDPLDGFVIDDNRFQPIELNDWETRPPSWHAAWKHPEDGGATISVWRLTVPELRNWMLSRGGFLDVPDDVWQTIAEQGVIEFDERTTYDVSANLLMSLNGVEASDLLPIELEDWIDFVEPVNADPLSPR